MNYANLETAPHRIRDWVIGHLIQDVPDDISLCEFDCRKRQCRWGEWEDCQRRLRFARLSESKQETPKRPPRKRG